MSAKNFAVGLFGFGTIGVGVVNLLNANAGLIEEKTGVSFKLKKIVDIDITTDRGAAVPAGVLSTSRNDILDDPEIEIVIELIGGAGAAREIVSECLKKGKHVVTANKELIAKHGPELSELAKSSGVKLLFEASVGGGVPILTPLLTCLRANRIHRVLGIVNGTTNFILTQMETTGAEFGDILKEAQKLGYAEADPTNDIEGFDAAYKAVILAAAAFGKRISIESVSREGISKVSRRDMEFAKELGYTIKLLAALEDTETGTGVRVQPTLLPRSHPLASINGVMNAVYIEGSPIGPLMFVGRGAGPDATSSAVFGDVISIAAASGKADSENIDIFKPAVCMPADSAETAFYVRMIVDDKPGVLMEISRCLGENSVSMASLVQKAAGEDGAELVMLTHRVKESGMFRALDSLRALSSIRDLACALRVFDK